ncbi:hypothetical protein QN277_018872 [Acacia crassicarpa]|uniref:Disease resistance protein n=1 Tax=Acacia crassicarpa TaxID=499986 RepID=A0AAE1MUU4_9FABA|nr:hypothetical protein QN277_018872 [Acacia crassicarpa]
MVEVGVSVVAKLAEYLVDPTLRQLQYLFCVGKVTRNVEIRKEELIFKQGRVQERVQEAINRTERIDDEVDNWKKDVESLIAKVENLEQELKAYNGCLRGWCPTWRRYRLCKMLAKTTNRMIVLNTKSDCFNPFSHPTIIPDIEYHTSQNFKLFNSTQMAFDQLWEALKDDGSFIIGLWGMGGSGKTTLVKEVGKKAKESQLFDRVVLTTISQSPDIRKIQGEIADTFGIKLEEESEIGRAKRIALRLENKEQILIILDDVWAKINLEDIGIPFGGNHQRSCKVVLTTRRLDVCTLMECEKMIRLDLLKKDEAWTLFQTHANVSDAAKEDVARAIVMECKGLPIAIVAVGTCLRGKGIDEMKQMLYRLCTAKEINVDKGVTDAFACLELSYDYLETHEAKLLLMCAMFPEDRNIDVEDLFRYGMGLGLCRDVDLFETARSKVKTIINHLIDSSLLMRSPKFNKGRQEYVRMHDVVRDFVLWKASKEHPIIMVNCIEEFDKLIVDEALNDCYAFSILLQFPSQVQDPKLGFLLLRSSELLDISHATFEGIKGLKALIMKSTKWWSKIELQPQSIQYLSNLRTLRLQDWNLCDISFVVSLTRLEILDLQGSEFAKVPDGIEKLSKLKLLDLSRCKIDECCYKVMGRCSQLEELYVSKHFSHPRNTNCYEYLGGSTANLLKFRRYNLEIGELYGRDLLFQNEGTRSLCFGQLNISLLGAVFKDLAQRATIIKFYELKGRSKSFMADIVQAIGGMNELTTLCLETCWEIEYIIDETTPHEDAFVPRLDELVLIDMHFLKQLWCGPPPFSLFQKLKRLTIFDCSQLLDIFPEANCNLGNLKFLTISSCPKLTSLFPVSAACTLLSLMELRIDDAPQMKFVFGEEQDESHIELRLLEYLKLLDLPNLVGICSGRYCPRWPSIKEINWRNCPNLKLQQLEGHQLRNEEYKSMASIELDNCGVESIFHYQTGLEEQILTFQFLEELTLKNCARLKFVFCGHIFQNLPELTSLTISCCEELEAIFLGNEETQKNLPITESFLLKLKWLRISKCNKLKFVLSFMISASTSMLPQLCTLYISDCSQMEEVFKCSNIQHHDIDSDREITLPNMESIELNNLPRFVNFCQGFKFHTGELGRIEIHDCPKLMPVKSASIDWTKERHVREYVLKYDQLNDNEALNLPLSVLIAGDLDIQSPRVEHHNWRIIGDDEQEESNHSEQRMLEGLVPTQVLKFQYVHSLEVTHCKRLKYLFSVRTIVQNSLPNLNSLTLHGCEELEEIIGEKDEHKTMSNFQVGFPELRELKVEMCDKLKRLFSASASTIVLSSLREIKLSNLPNFKCIFPSAVMRSLPCLWFLQIEECEELEEIMSSEEEHNHFPNNSLCFPQLYHITVKRCRKLKWLLPSLPSILLLPRLESLRIEECSQLKGLCDSEVEIHEEGFYNNSLPKLLVLTVKDCPIFSETTLAALQSWQRHNSGTLERQVQQLRIHILRQGQ